MTNLKPEDFEIGDVVQLKSGGPDMTVNEVEINVIKCTYWHEGEAKFKYFNADFALLNKI